MFKLLYAGFDTLDVAFAGALSPEALSALEASREEAQANQYPSLLKIGPGKVRMHVYGHGMRGGYAFIADTGPLGAKWLFKKNLDPRQWNIFVSPAATMLLAYGYELARDRIFDELLAMGANISDHSVNRVDFAMDFQTLFFEARPEQFVAHSHTKVSPHWAKEASTSIDTQPTSVLRGRRVESVTIGKQPGRQIIVYDKRREAIERRKYFWFETWGINPKDKTSEVWRVEIRAGKRELKDRYQIRKFDDIECQIGDVVKNALNEIRYLADQQSDSNVTRQALHPLWITAMLTVENDLAKFRSGVTPQRMANIINAHAQDQYLSLCIGNAIGLGVTHDLSVDEFFNELPVLLVEKISKKTQKSINKYEKAMLKTRNRLSFKLK